MFPWIWYVTTDPNFIQSIKNLCTSLGLDFHVNVILNDNRLSDILYDNIRLQKSPFDSILLLLIELNMQCPLTCDLKEAVIFRVYILRTWKMTIIF